jgi:Flp pilus assembly protein TadG
VRERLRRRRGISLLYMIIYMIVLAGFCSLAVDLGRVQLAKTELHRAADTAARAGAAGLMDSPAEAIIQARSYASRNSVDGQPLRLNSGDIQIGKWDTKRRTFTQAAGSSDLATANAVRVMARRNAARRDGVPLMFASLLGINQITINAESIAMVVPPVNVDQYVPATGNPFLSGMPPGSVASEINPHYTIDYAGTPRDPKQSPLVVNMPISEGDALTFDSITGTARHDPDLPFFDPDGELSDIGHNNLTRDTRASFNSNRYNQNGIADMRAPINALVGVFLSDEQPNRTPAPRNLDFATPASRNFEKLEPELKQIFWIGDGEDSRGVRQQFIAPKGATRLYLATWDFYEWNNNYGFRNVKVTRPMRVITVR